MEAINSMASAAAKAVWGESNTKENENPAATTTTTTNTTTMNNESQGQEPISGKQGDVSKGEPFDAGNIEPSSETAPVESSTPAVESKGPTTDQPSTTGDTHFKAAQADIRDPDTNPTADPKTETERKNVDDGGAGLDESENPAKVDGPGPKPIDEVARERGGDAGKTEGTGAGAGAGSGDLKSDAAAGAAGEGAKEGEGEEKSESKGSGEQYVKSSGLAADGGDFDATKPGAGREADRLLEEKGIANPALAAANAKKSEDTTDTPDSPEEGKEKKSLKEKIKAKLHKN